MNGNNDFCSCASDHLLPHRHYSAWLRSTLTDMDRKTETMLEVLVDKSIREIVTPNQALVQSLISELRDSYHAIADKCDSLLLMDQTSQSSEFSSSSTSRSGEEDVAVAGRGLNEEVSLRLNEWEEMRMSTWKLVEDNLRQQEELIKRNHVKREEIERLGHRLEQLDRDNAQLKQSLQMVRNRTKHDDEVKGNKKRRQLLPRRISTWFKACFTFDRTQN